MTIPRKFPGLIVHQAEPLNAGPPLEQLCETPITPGAAFFVRSHALSPSIAAEHYMCEVGGLVARPVQLTLAELLRRYPRRELAATLQCAGNRRNELLALGPIPGELAWGAEAIGTAVWGGIALADLLAEARPLPGAAHVAFESYDTVTKSGATFPFGGSIPLEKALRAEVLIAYEMNGAPLLPEHGFPLRLVVPGYIGARSVKWLRSITLQPDPSDNYFQAQAYRLRPPFVAADHALPLGELSVTAAVCSPAPGAVLASGAVYMRGYAMAGGERRIARVDISADGGASWAPAELLGDDLPWCWRLWQATLILPPGAHRLVVRAWDTAANTQPEELRSVWNEKGYMNNAWHTVDIRTE
jgi:sulfite oxidase